MEKIFKKKEINKSDVNNKDNTQSVHVNNQKIINDLILSIPQELMERQIEILNKIKDEDKK